MLTSHKKGSRLRNVLFSFHLYEEVVEGLYIKSNQIKSNQHNQINTINTYIEGCHQGVSMCQAIDRNGSSMKVITTLERKRRRGRGFAEIVAHRTKLDAADYRHRTDGGDRDVLCLPTYGDYHHENCGHEMSFSWVSVLVLYVNNKVYLAD